MRSKRLWSNHCHTFKGTYPFLTTVIEYWGIVLGDNIKPGSVKHKTTEHRGKTEMLRNNGVTAGHRRNTQTVESDKTKHGIPLWYFSLDISFLFLISLEQWGGKKNPLFSQITVTLYENKNTLYCLSDFCY